MWKNKRGIQMFYSLLFFFYITPLITCSSAYFCIYSVLFPALSPSPPLSDFTTFNSWTIDVVGKPASSRDAFHWLTLKTTVLDWRRLIAGGVGGVGGGIKEVFVGDWFSKRWMFCSLKVREVAVWHSFNKYLLLFTYRLKPQVRRSGPFIDKVLRAPV